MKPLRRLLAAFSLCLLAIPMAASGQSAVQTLTWQPSSTGSAPDLGVEEAAPASTSLLEIPAVAGIAEPTLLLPQARVRNRRGIPLMVAGGAAFVAGIIAGGDAGTILMLGGGGIGAWGLYVYFGG
jgi:hypothetical protein